MAMNDFYIWETLLQAAIVGTGKGVLPPPLLDHFMQKGLSAHSTPEETLLEASALTRLRIRAGRNFPHWEGSLPEGLPPEEEDIHVRAGRFLSAILSGRFAPALEEWLRLFAASGSALPPEGLPGLLDRCAGDEGVRNLVMPHLGERARWLIAQNPAWAPLAVQGPKKKHRLKETPLWTEKHARDWVAELQLLLISAGDNAWHLWDYRDKLREAAYLVPPIPDAPWLGGWEHIPNRTAFLWKNDIDSFLHTVQFRIEMYEAFNLNA